MKRCRWLLVFVGVGIMVAACGESEDPPPPDKGIPTPDSTVFDAQLDYGTVDLPKPDRGVDQGIDLTPDLVELPPDLGPDLDDLPPTVTSTAPFDTENLVKATQVLSVTFSEAMDQSTATAASFRLETQGVPIPAKLISGQKAISVFEPAYPLCPLRDYKATVTTAFRDLAGNALVSDHSWTFTTADGSWTAPTLQSAERINGALAQNGDMFIVYASQGAIYGRRYDSAGYSWLAPVQIAVATAFVRELAVAADALGNAVAAWRTSGTTDDLVAARYDATTKLWSAAASLESGAGDVDAGPSVAMSASGKAMVVYQQIDGTATKVFYNLHDGQSWSARAALPSQGTKPDRAVRVVSNGLEDFFAAWYDEVSKFTYALRALRYDGTTGAWETSAKVLAAKVSSSNDIPLAASPAGAAAGWRVRPATGPGSNLLVARWVAGTWSAATDVSQNGLSYVYSPTIAMNLSGDVYAAWEQPSAVTDAGITKGAKLRIYDALAMTWSAPKVLGPDGDAIRIALDAAGNGFITWDEYSAGLKGARILNGQVGTATQLTPPRQGWVDTHTLIANACGQGLLALRYANEGPISSPEYLVFR